MQFNEKNISIVIPTFNEKEIIKETLRNLINYLEKQKIGYEIIIIDKKSTDGTVEIIKNISKENSNVKYFEQSSKGFGGALIEGSRKSKNKIVAWVMGDSSDELSTLGKMLEKINLGYDLVVGSRNIPGGSRGDQVKIKAFNSWIYSNIARIIFNFKVHEITNAFRMFRKRLIEEIKFERNDFAISPEFSIKAHLKKYKLGEVPTTYNERKQGESKMNLIKMGIIYYKLLIKYRLGIGIN